MKRNALPTRLAREIHKQGLRNLMGLPPRDQDVGRGMAEILTRQEEIKKVSPLAGKMAHLDRMDRLRRDALEESVRSAPEAVVKARRLRGSAAR